MPYSFLYSFNVFILSFIFISCGMYSNQVVLLPPVQGPQVMRLTVNGDTCLPSSYYNQPCVSVEICASHNNAKCQKINGILLDTGSKGLRIMRHVIDNDLASQLEHVKNHRGETIYTNIKFLDTSRYYGATVRAYVGLGQLRTTQAIDIQLVDRVSCSNMEDPEALHRESGFLNGILGIAPNIETEKAPFIQPRPSFRNFSDYVYRRSLLTSQNAVDYPLHNPIAFLPKGYNEGYVIGLPSIVNGQSYSSLEGYVLLGLREYGHSYQELQAKALPYNDQFEASLKGNSARAFLDTGCNNTLLPPSMRHGHDLGECSVFQKGYICPASHQTRPVITFLHPTMPYKKILVNLPIYHAQQMLNHLPHHKVVPAIASHTEHPYFLAGLPFFFGKIIYFGIEGKTSPLGTHPLVAIQE